jgi:hypothetical protein
MKREAPDQVLQRTDGRAHDAVLVQLKARYGQQDPFGRRILLPPGLTAVIQAIREVLVACLAALQVLAMTP